MSTSTVSIKKVTVKTGELRKVKFRDCIHLKFLELLQSTRVEATTQSREQIKN